MDETKYLCAAICLNGHEINSCLDDPKCEEKFCQKCGAQVITECPNCKKPIRGHLDDIDSPLRNYQIPKYCLYCGKPFPWTESALKAANELITEDDNLSDIDKGKLSECLPDIIAETPRTQLAATRIKKSIKVAGQFTAEAIRQFVIDFGCELALKATGISK